MKTNNMMTCPNCNELINLSKTFPKVLFLTDKEFELIENRLNIPTIAFDSAIPEGLTRDDFIVPMSLINKMDLELKRNCKHDWKKIKEFNKQTMVVCKKCHQEDFILEEDLE